MTMYNCDKSQKKKKKSQLDESQLRELVCTTISPKGTMAISTRVRNDGARQRSQR